jgi:uncharacterized protein (DUF1697 family)
LAVATFVVLLRGINIGARNRVAMPALRSALEDAGFGDVRTYLQSGNVVLSGAGKTADVTRKCERLIADRFGLDIRVVVRTKAELARAVKQNPLKTAVADPKRFQVSFLDGSVSAAVRRQLEEVRVDPEQLAVRGREVYAWHPKGVARSKLWALLAGPKLGVTATSRNWTTVTKLLELAG